MTPITSDRPDWVVTSTDLRDKQTDVLDEVYRGRHALVTRDGRPRAVLVPLEWWQEKNAGTGADQ